VNLESIFNVGPVNFPTTNKDQGHTWTRSPIFALALNGNLLHSRSSFKKIYALALKSENIYEFFEVIFKQNFAIIKL